MDRRQFLLGLGLSAAALPAGASAEFDHLTLRIGKQRHEIAARRWIETTAYNGCIPGPLLRLKQNRPVDLTIENHTGSHEYVHWHGLSMDAAYDGTEEEKSLGIHAGGRLRYRFRPREAGSRYVHSHAMAGKDLMQGVYSGQFAFVYVEPPENPGAYDQEVFLAAHEFEPSFARIEAEEETRRSMVQQRHDQDEDDGDTANPVWEVVYRSATINGKMLGHGEPVRVKRGERVLFHILNASATENLELALPGHHFQIVAMDGNPVPRKTQKPVLSLAVGERVDALVTMDCPGVWVLGALDDAVRGKGMGIVVEYANRSGTPAWSAPGAWDWQYSDFAAAAPTLPFADELVPLDIDCTPPGEDGFEQWLINGKLYKDHGPPMRLHRGRRYRFAFRNLTEEGHAIHLHRFTFELVAVNGHVMSGLHKDVFLLPAYGTAAIDFTPDAAGLTLLHCHQQLHMDCGFKQNFEVI